MTWLVVCRDSDSLWPSLRRHGFTSMQVHVGFMVNKFTLGQAVLPLLQFSTVSIIPPMLHTHSFIYHPRCIMFFSKYFGFPCQYYFTNAPYSLIHSLIRSFIYCRRCITFFSQYFSFPCQYHSTNTPYSSIRLPPTLYNVFLPVLQFPLSVSFHQCSILIYSSTTHAV